MNLILLTGLGVVLLGLIATILMFRLQAANPSDLPPTEVEVFSPTATAFASLATPAATEGSAELTATTIPAVAFTASDPATCKPASIVPVASAETEALYPSVSAGDWTLGPKNAPVIIYEYSDFQCPYCAKAAPALRDLQAAYPRDVQIVFRHFPLSSIHPNAIMAARAAEAAGIQNKFWQMHDLLFDKQSEWSSLTTEDFKIWLKDASKSLNLNSNQFINDLDSNAVVQKIDKAESDALAAGLNSTPTILFNKIRYQGRNDLESLTGIVEYFLLPQKSFQDCPAMTINPEKTYTVTIKTEKGDILSLIHI
jgi:protein-disulfide isomerase